MPLFKDKCKNINELCVYDSETFVIKQFRPTYTYVHEHVCTLMY